MKYKSFHFKNFKGIKETTIDLYNGGVVCLLGLNEQGKTTILKGIDLCYKHVKETINNAARFELTNGYLAEIAPREDNFTGNIELSLTLLNDDKTERKVSFVYQFKNNASRAML